MSGLQHVTDHEAQGPDKLVQQFKNKPAIVGVLQAWAKQVQALEDQGYELVLQRALESATGVSLDVIGALVGQAREGRSDSQYKIWIAGRVLVNKSRGRPPQLIAIASKLCQGPVRFTEFYPAAFVIYSDAPILGTDGVEVAKLLKLAKAAGVAMRFVWFDVPTPFRFSLTGTSVFNSARGFDHGRLAAVSDGRDMDFAPPVPVVVPDPGGAALLLVL